MLLRWVWLAALLCNAFAGWIAFQGFVMIGAAGSGDSVTTGAVIVAGVIPMMYAVALSVISTCGALAFEYLAKDRTQKTG